MLRNPFSPEGDRVLFLIVEGIDVEVPQEQFHDFLLAETRQFLRGIMVHHGAGALSPAYGMTPSRLSKIASGETICDKGGLALPDQLGN